MQGPFAYFLSVLLGATWLIAAFLAAASFIVLGGSADAMCIAFVLGHLLVLSLLSLGAIAALREHRRETEAEEAQRTAESRTRTILDTAIDAIISIDEWGTIEAANPATERLFGFAISELIGRNVKLLMPAGEREAHDGHLARYRATGERKVVGIGREVTCRRKDGTEFPADLAVGEYRVGEHRKFTGFLRDISERKRAEARIREQATLLDKAQEAIHVRDLSDRITYWNLGAERLYGWTADEARDRNCADLLCRGASAAFEAGRRAVLGEGEWVGELRQITKGGREILVESRWSTLSDNQERPMAVLVIDIDITERKDRERQALRAQRLESIGTLTGGIAHDLNNMLTPILMSARLLQRDRPAAEREKLLVNIQASAERGAEMVKQLLSFTGGLETQRARVDLQAVIREIRSLLDHTLPKSITIETRVAPDLWTVSGDTTQLSQVLMNLCVNARDAMAEGGTLTIRAENCVSGQAFSETFPDAVPGDYSMLSVADTGEGIPPEVIDRVFDPFFTTKELGKGTGLGLSTVLGIVRSHGGFVRVDSDRGQGARFSVYLPAFELAPLRKAKNAVHVPSAGNGRLVLVVEDEEFIRYAVESTLQEAGYQVITACDGREARAVVEQRPGQIRAALVDMMMPGIDGPAIMQSLREVDPGIRIIANSGLRVAEEHNDVVERCAQAFLQKPYTDQQLLQALSQVLGNES